MNYFKIIVPFIGLIKISYLQAQNEVYYEIDYGAMEIRVNNDQTQHEPPIVIPYMDSMYYNLTDSSLYVLKLNELILSRLESNPEYRGECAGPWGNFYIQVDKDTSITPTVIIYTEDCNGHNYYDFLYWDFFHEGAYGAGGWSGKSTTIIIGFGMDDHQLLFDYHKLEPMQLLEYKEIRVKLDLKPQQDAEIEKVLSKIL